MKVLIASPDRPFYNGLTQQLRLQSDALDVELHTLWATTLDATRTELEQDGASVAVVVLDTTTPANALAATQSRLALFNLARAINTAGYYNCYTIAVGSSRCVAAMGLFGCVPGDKEDAEELAGLVLAAGTPD